MHLMGQALWPRLRQTLLLEEKRQQRMRVEKAFV
jgi:hypothetical protein